jgi:thiol-disulfide isomerase/thioredoxin
MRWCALLGDRAFCKIISNNLIGLINIIMSDNKRMLFYGLGALAVAAILVFGFIMWERKQANNNNNNNNKKGNVEFVDAHALLSALHKPEKPVMTMWYADWCPHCTTALPAFVEASKLDKGRELRWLAIESSKLDGAPDSIQVEGFPTIRRFAPTPVHDEGVWTTHKGTRTADGFYAFARSKH